MLTNLFIFLIGMLKIFTAIAASAFFCVLVHELGHAAAMLLSSGIKVEVYVGSIGNIVPGATLSFGRLSISVSYNPFLWLRGMCKPEGSFSLNKQLFYVSTGPLASVFLTVLAYQLLAVTEVDGFARWLLVLILFFSGSLSFSCIIPFKYRRPYGYITGNDAYIFIKLLRKKSLPSAIFQVTPLVQQGKLQEAIHVFESNVVGRSRSFEIDRVGVWLYMHTGNFQRALEFNERLGKKTRYGANDFINSGYVQCMLGNQKVAVSLYEKALRLDPDNLPAITNLSYSLVLLKQYNKAIEYADRAILINPDCAASLDNRGLARLRTGLLEEGRMDIEASIRLDGKQAEVYRNLGIYFLLMKEWKAAIAVFQKAKEMNKAPANIDEYIAEANAGQDFEAAED